MFANIILLLVFAVGYAASRDMTRETFPDFSTDEVFVTVVYPGADPAEVEEGISRKVEEALEGLVGVKRLTTVSNEGMAIVTAEVQEGYDKQVVLDRVRSRMDSIENLPVDAEKPVLSDRLKQELVLLVALSADVPERRLKRLAEDMKDEIRELSGVSQVRVAGARDFEISVEVTEEKLQAHDLTLEDLGRAIRASSFNLAGGTVRTEGEEIRLRTLGRKYTGDEFGEIVVKALPNGDIITLDQVADVRDGFIEESFAATLNGAPAVFLIVSKTREEDSIEISDAVHAYAAAKRLQLPPGTQVDLMYDMSEYLRSRINLLLKNGLAGLILVCLLVWLLLDFRLSFWVSMGIPISIAGGLACMWALGETINMISLFGLIVILGLVVDDAIVVGEAIYRQRAAGLPPVEAAVEGMAEVGWPVLAGVTTSMLAFLPLAYVSGVMGTFIRILPVVVISCLAVSLVEVLLLFPAHLRHLADPNERAEPRVPFLRRVHRVRQGLQRALDGIIADVYTPALGWILEWRYAALGATAAIGLFLAGLITSGILPFQLFSRVDGSILTATVELPGGTPSQVTGEAVRRIEEAILQVGEQTRTRSGGNLVKHRLTLSGGSLGGDSKVGTHVGSVQVVLADAKSRGVHSDDLLVAWENEVGRIAGADSMVFENSESTPVQRPIDIWFRGRDLDELLAATTEVMRRLDRYAGVYQVERSFRQGKKEIRFELKPEARALGLTVADLASQLHARYFGHEAVRVQRGREDVKVKVRYTAAERSHLSTLDGIRIRTPLGHEVPLFSVARASTSPGYASITRIDGMRSVTVSAAVDTSEANARQIVQALKTSYLPDLRDRYPDLRVEFRGEQKEIADSFGSLKTGVPLAIIGIFVLIASVFRSYVQPVVILFSVPLGIFGALIGHLLMGLTITMLSLFGMVALAGVAVNDAIVMIEAVNDNLARGLPFREAVIQGGIRRFRAVFLTTVTTVCGLSPIIFETDFQAQFLIPMAVSIAAGELFGTSLTVFLVPVMLVVLNDLRCLVSRVTRGEWPAAREALEPASRRAPIANAPRTVQGNEARTLPSASG